MTAGAINRCESPDCVCSPTNTPQELVAPVASDPEGATGVPSARALLVAAYAEEWPPLCIWPPEPDRVQRELDDQRRFIARLLATPSGQRLAAIVDAAVAFAGWMESDTLRSDLELRLQDAVQS